MRWWRACPAFVTLEFLGLRLGIEPLPADGHTMGVK